MGMRSVRQNSIILEHGHVAYGIKGDHKLQQNGSKYYARRLLPSHNDPRVWGRKVKIQFVRNTVMLYIKLKGIANAATW